MWCASRFVTSLLFFSAFVSTAAGGWCAEPRTADDIDQQITYRVQQYRESLRQRAEQLSPSLQSTIKSQVQRTVAKGLEKWKNGELHLWIALPARVEALWIAQFLARHTSFPGETLELGAGMFVATLTITSILHVLLSRAFPVDDVVVVRSVDSHRQNDISYFIRIVRTIVQRR